jgi:hypothetical protein
MEIGENLQNPFTFDFYAATGGRPAGGSPERARWVER